jgi:hypothetical protein
MSQHHQIFHLSLLVEAYEQFQRLVVDLNTHQVTNKCNVWTYPGGATRYSSHRTQTTWLVACIEITRLPACFDQARDSDWLLGYEDAGQHAVVQARPFFSLPACACGDGADDDRWGARRVGDLRARGTQPISWIDSWQVHLLLHNVRLIMEIQMSTKAGTLLLVNSAWPTEYKRHAQKKEHGIGHLHVWKLYYAERGDNTPPLSQMQLCEKVLEGDWFGTTTYLQPPSSGATY